MRVLAQITENRKVEARKPLIFLDTVFAFYIEKVTLRQSRLYHAHTGISKGKSLMNIARQTIGKRSGCCSVEYAPGPARLGASAASLVLAAYTQSTSGGELGAILDRYATDMLRESPELASGLGVSDAQAGGRYIDRLSDVSRDGLRRQRGIAEAALAALGHLDRASLCDQDRVTYDVVTTALRDTVDAANFETGTGAQAPYTVTQLTGNYAFIPDFLASQHPITNREEAEAYLTRLSAYARVLDQETTRIGEDAAAGVLPPDFTLDGAVRQLRGFAETPPAQTVLVASLQARLADVEETKIPDADKTALIQLAEAMVRDEVLPAYRRQIDALNALKPRATHDAGVWKLPRGEELYATALRANTTTTMSPDDIHQLGTELVASLNAEMDAILRAQGMPNGTLAERLDALARRPDQIYPNTDAGRARLLADLNAQVEIIRARMPEVCGTLAHAALEIRRVPEFTEVGAPGGYYQPGALDGSRPGAYYINLRNPAEEWPKFSLPTLTYHEGIPGHHWQISIQQESGSIPFIRSALLGFTAYAEGWALYAEQLADEMGLYANDPLGRLGYLQSAAFRASRLVVDTGLHAKRWTREQAIASMVAATGDQESNIVTEIERYCVWPGQACAYMIGRQALKRLRESARATLGARFDLKGFHDVVLTNGSTPLSVTEQLVQQWVASVQKG
jgi:uncharacterized protein (DUF885 family)